MKRIIVHGLLALSMALVLAGCVFDPEKALQTAIDALDRNSRDWQKVLEKLQAKATDDVKDIIKDQVQSVASRTVAEAGTDIRCDIDFIGQRVRQGLQRILDHLRKPTVPIGPPVPAFCTADPLEIDVIKVRQRTLTSLAIYGYDMFDRNADDATTRAFLRDRDGTEHDISAVINRPTHYLMTVTLRDDRVNFTNNTDKLIIRAGSATLSTLKVIPDDTPPPLKLNRFGIAFGTLDDGKDEDTGVSLTIEDVEQWSMPQSGRGKMIFPPRHVDWWMFGEGVPITNVSGKKLRICSTPTGRDVWRFNFRLFGTYSDSANNTKPCVDKPAGMHCYIFEQASVELSQSHRCQDWTLP